MTFPLRGGNVTFLRRAFLFLFAPRPTYWSAFFYDHIPRAIKKCYSRGSLEENSLCLRIEIATGMKFAIVSMLKKILKVHVYLSEGKISGKGRAHSSETTFQERNIKILRKNVKETQCHIA